MIHYFASDIHLREDRPERGHRFARWVGRLEADSDLTIVGDLFDFWMGARSSEQTLAMCEGFQALIRFRDRGGALSIMAGNHDRWLLPAYERLLGASLLEEPANLLVHGLRVHLVHGHLLGARRKWKALMESQGFFKAFGYLPYPVARPLDLVLEAKNVRGLAEDEKRHLAIYRAYASRKRGEVDLVIIGHVHCPVDDSAVDPRMVVLGGWQRGSSYLEIGPFGAIHHVVSEGQDFPLHSAPAAASPAPHTE